MAGFADQQMHMLRHNYISEQPKLDHVSDSCQLLDKDIPRLRGIQKRQTSITTEGNKMQMTLAIVTLQPSRHGQLHGENGNPKTQV
jgi:hypothetical protein